MKRATKGAPSLLAALNRLLPGDTWRPWRLVGRAVFGLTAGLSDDDRAFLARVLGGRDVPTTRSAEAWMVVGRRGGKSRFSAVVAVLLACFSDYRGVLAAGEVATIMLIAADRKQARVVRRYIGGFLQGHSALRSMVVHETAERIEFSNQVTIEIHTASFRTVRGYTLAGVIADEIAFWPSDGSADPDVEVLNALRPAMATIPNALLLCLSSPYARRGELWRAYRECFGKSDAAALVFQADSRTMNPALSQRVVDLAYARDSVSASAEFGGQFRTDIGSLVAPEALARAVVAGRRELPPVAGVAYIAFVDPSGGSADSMTLGIAHVDGEVLVLDAVREHRPPFSPEHVATDFADVCRRYAVKAVTGDRFGGEFVREQFRKQGITYQPSESTRSDLYLELLPLLNSRRLELLDDARLLAQLTGLERRSGSTGRDVVDHPRGGHDDVANAAAGALVLASRSPSARKLPATFTSCARLSVGLPAGCPLLGGLYFPQDPACRPCVGKVHAKEAYRRHVERGGEAIGLDAFTRGRFRDNEFTSRLNEQRGIDALFL